ncbi:hypothetical protein [Pedobacter frigoris]|uniref:hypothetical protein n=1 Tax=Pedobacter frigoris TaxID=2571272 RepID=UPI00293002C6|nr:hypothetical protein [Pedobacter frigoris]
MKLMKYLVKQSLILSGLLFLASCSDGEKGAAGKKTSETKKPAGQFVFYKDIEIRPGINFELISWGKGVDSIGGYTILMSDSIRNNYKSFSNERKGIITDAWNMDMDNDGDPEIYIELLSKKNVKDLNVYEYSGGSFNKISFPPLSSRAKESYAGDDKFSIKNGELFRTYPLVNPKDTSIKAGDMKYLQYSLRGNSFEISELKKGE